MARNDSPSVSLGRAICRELWKRRDEVAAEFLCWHSVAYLCLITIGKLPPHDEQARSEEHDVS